MSHISSSSAVVNIDDVNIDEPMPGGNTAIRIGSRVQATTPDGVLMLSEPATVIGFLDGGSVAQLDGHRGLEDGLPIRMLWPVAQLSIWEPKPKRSAPPKPARAPFVRIPSSHLGRIFAAGPKDAAKAVQLLAIKLSYAWGGFVLNEAKERKPVSQRGHAVPRDAFQEGLAHLIKAGVLDRRLQGGRRPRDPSNPGVSKRGRYATETLVPAGEHGVDIPLQFASEGVRNRRICGFIAAALLPPKPVKASEAARRIDIVGRVAINGLVKAAVDAGAIAAVRIIGSDWMVGRNQAAVEAAAAECAPKRRRVENSPVESSPIVDSSPVENAPVENPVVESSPTHSLSVLTSSSPESTSSSSVTTSPPAPAEAPAPGGGEVADVDFSDSVNGRLRAFVSQHGKLSLEAAGAIIAQQAVLFGIDALREAFTIAEVGVLAGDVKAPLVYLLTAAGKVRARDKAAAAGYVSGGRWRVSQHAALDRILEDDDPPQASSYMPRPGKPSISLARKRFLEKHAETPGAGQGAALQRFMAKAELEAAGVAHQAPAGDSRRNTLSVARQRLLERQAHAPGVGERAANTRFWARSELEDNGIDWRACAPASAADPSVA